ncbi:MAG TPA: hypothetical protein DEP38_12560 [Cyanobacteria bacterium UBA9226]|nr:hypothetical protein [Cyanobacteria bacterium UBA9226]
MARWLERIQQEITAQEKAIGLLVTEFQTIYSQYLTLLGQALHQQLMQASYHVCTQGYPESFLALSFDGRHQLQQDLRKISKESQAELRSHLERWLKEWEVGEQFLAVKLPKMNYPFSKLQEEIEEEIAKTLQNISIQTNQLLQDRGIIPHKLPSKVLEAAAKSEASTEMNPGAANLLNLVVETKNDEDPEDSNLMRILAINLRLSEIEFSDSSLTVTRNQIRSLAAKGGKLQRDYRKIQRELAIAKAEAAWRSSWFEDN